MAKRARTLYQKVHAIPMQVLPTLFCSRPYLSGNTKAEKSHLSLLEGKTPAFFRRPKEGDQLYLQSLHFSH